MIAYTHDISLVLASITVSLVAAFTGLALTNNIASQPDIKRKALVVMSAFILGGGIWSMHFVAMLAHEFSVPIYYDLLQTLASALIAILVVGVALLMLHFSTRTTFVLSLAGLILGAGIVLMHYIGMMAIRGCTPVFSAASIVLALLVAAVAGVTAIRVAYGRRSKQNIIVGSVVFGFAVVAVHYTAMSGTRFMVDESHRLTTSSLANSSLAIAVTMASFVICGSFLLAATTFLTSSNHPADGDAATDSTGTQTEAATLAPNALRQEPDSSDAADSITPTDSRSNTSLPESLLHSGTLQIPFEQGKKIEFADSSEVAAIRADGHYTHLYTQQGVRFCPWSITEAEQRLAQCNFHRTHRSYLVNIAAIDSFEKRKESGVCLFRNFPQLSSVPVSRSRILTLVDVLNATGSITG